MRYMERYLFLVSDLRAGQVGFIQICKHCPRCWSFSRWSIMQVDRSFSWSCWTYSIFSFSPDISTSWAAKSWGTSAFHLSYDLILNKFTVKTRMQRSCYKYLTAVTESNQQMEMFHWRSPETVLIQCHKRHWRSMKNVSELNPINHQPGCRCFMEIHINAAFHLYLLPLLVLIKIRCVRYSPSFSS